MPPPSQLFRNPRHKSLVPLPSFVPSDASFPVDVNAASVRDDDILEVFQRKPFVKALNLNLVKRRIRDRLFPPQPCFGTWMVGERGGVVHLRALRCLPWSAIVAVGLGCDDPKHEVLRAVLVDGSHAGFGVALPDDGVRDALDHRGGARRRTLPTEVGAYLVGGHVGGIGIETFNKVVDALVEGASAPAAEVLDDRALGRFANIAERV